MVRPESVLSERTLRMPIEGWRFQCPLSKENVIWLLHKVVPVYVSSQSFLRSINGLAYIDHPQFLWWIKKLTLILIQADRADCAFLNIQDAVVIRGFAIRCFDYSRTRKQAKPRITSKKTRFWAKLCRNEWFRHKRIPNLFGTLTPAINEGNVCTITFMQPILFWKNLAFRLLQPSLAPPPESFTHCK